MRGRDHGTNNRYLRGPDEHGRPGKGCRCTPCRDAHIEVLAWRRRMIAYGRWEAPHQDAAGTRRRLQALVAAGWSQQRLADRLGTDQSYLSVIMRRERVTTQTARAVTALYDALWDQPPPERTHGERSAASKARNRASARGWPTAWAWDDNPGPHWIEDPDARPAPGWKRQGAA